MKKRLYAIPVALLLSTVMLAGCGEASEVVDRTSRNQKEQSYEDRDDRDSSKKDRDKEDSSSVAGDEQDQENTFNALEDERVQENTSNISEDEQTQENTSNISEDEQTQENTFNVTANDPSQTPPPSTVPAADSAEVYTEDLKAFITLFAVEDISYDDPVKMISELQTLINGLNVKSPEALVVKSDLQELVDILSSLVSVLNIMDDPSAFLNLDLNVLNNSLDKIDELSEAIEDHAEAFISAAEASGIDEDTLKELEEMATSLSSWEF